MMARRSSRIQEVSERNEVSCMWGLFSILESCQSRPSQKVISNGNRHIIDYPRKLDTIASFDEQCRKIHNGVGLRTIPTENHKSRQNIVKRQQYTKMDAELLNRLMKTHKRTRKRSCKEAYQSSSCCLNNAAMLMPYTSAEISLEKLTLTAILGPVCAQNRMEESELSEYLQRNCDPGKYDQIDKINTQKAQMRAKAFVDQMFIERKLIKEARNSEPKSFSNSLEVLNSKKGLFMELLPDPNSMLARRFKNLNPSPMGKDTVESILGANIESEGIDADSSAKCGSELVMHKGNVNDKIVILKPAPRNAKHYGNITCNCSSLQFPNRSDRKVSSLKTTPFSLRRIKKKLKHTFGVAKKEPIQLLCSSDKLSSTNDRKKGKLTKNQELKPNIACVTDTARRKVDFSSARYSNKQEFDVVLKAKMHLSTRWNDLNSVEAVTAKNSPLTLERILSSPERDFQPFSPRRDSLYLSASAEMRFSPYNTPTRVFECSSHVQNEVTESDCNISTADSVKISGESDITEMNSFPPPELCDTRKVEKIDGSFTHSILAENKAVTSALDDFLSNSPNSHHLDTAENIKYQEEHRSPVSVLAPFSAEDGDSPTITLQSARKQLQPRRLDFEECELFPYYPSVNVDSCIEEEEEEEEDHLCQYVQSVLEASCLDWDKLSEIQSPPEYLLHESLFDEVELPPLDCCYDPKLLFDRTNEVLVDIYKCHLCFPPWVTKMRSAPLADVVLDEMSAEAEFFLLPTTEKRTLDQLVSRDVANSRSWLHIPHDSEHVATEISEAVLQESLLDTLVDLLT